MLGAGGGTDLVACGWPGGAGRWLANARRQTPLC